jgi:hypothetical protein
LKYNVTRGFFSAGIVLVPLVLAGCSTVAPIGQDQPVTLAKDEGLAAVQMDTIDPFMYIQFAPAFDDGQVLEIPSAPVGKSLYLFKARAGRYCLEKMMFGGIVLWPYGNERNCFEVPAGRIGFSGYLAPRAIQGKIQVLQPLDVVSGEEQLRRTYPRVAAQFLQATSGSAAPADTNEPISTWSERASDGIMWAVYFRNNTDRPIALTSFELYACANVKQECAVSHPDFRLSPHETRKYMDVAPADPLAVYSFRYNYHYEFAAGQAPAKPH